MIKKTILATTIVLMAAGVTAQQTDLPEPGITPGHPLYGLEKFSEQMALTVSQAPVIGSEELEAKVRANQAAETLAEARAMASRNRTADAEKLMQKYSENMNRSAASAKASSNAQLRERLGNVTRNQDRTINEIRDKLPPQARAGADKALGTNSEARRNLEKPGKRGGSKQSPSQGRAPPGR